MEQNQYQPPIQDSPKTSKKGIKVFLVILTAALLLTVGYIVYSLHQSKVSRLEAIISAKDKDIDRLKKREPELKAPEAPKYLEINEWGVKVPQSIFSEEVTYRISDRGTLMIMKSDYQVAYNNLSKGPKVAVDDCADAPVSNIVRDSYRSFFEEGASVPLKVVGDYGYLVPAPQSVCGSGSEEDTSKAASFMEDYVWFIDRREVISRMEVLE